MRGFEFWLVRLFLAACSIALCYKLDPFGFRGFSAIASGFFLALMIFLAELRLRRAGTSGLLGAALGMVWGCFPPSS